MRKCICLYMLLMLLIPTASAIETSSANYITNTVIVSGADTVSSTNYNTTVLIGQTVLGSTGSTNYNITFGFLGIVTAIDTTAPNITNTQLNKTSLNSSTEDLNFSFIITDTNLDSCWAELTLEDSSSSNISGNIVSDRCDVISTISQVGDFTFKSYGNDTFGNTGNGSSISGVRISVSLSELTLYNTTNVTVDDITYVYKNITGNNTLGSLNATNVTLNYTGLTNWTCSGILSSIDVENGSINTTEAYLCYKEAITEISPTCPAGYTNYSTFCRKSSIDSSYETRDYFSQFNITTNDTIDYNIVYNIPTTRLKNWGYRSITSYSVNSSIINVSLSDIAVLSITNNTLSEGIYNVNIQYKIPRAQVPDEGGSVIYPIEIPEIIEEIIEEIVEIIEERTVFEIYADYVGDFREQSKEIVVTKYPYFLMCMFILIMIILCLNQKKLSKKIKEINKKDKHL